jgi:hypothetical protein
VLDRPRVSPKCRSLRRCSTSDGGASVSVNADVWPLITAGAGGGISKALSDRRSFRRGRSRGAEVRRIRGGLNLGLLRRTHSWSTFGCAFHRTYPVRCETKCVRTSRSPCLQVRLPRDEVETEVRSFITKVFRQYPTKYGPRSLDQPIRDGDGRTLLDFIASDYDKR